MVQRLRARQEVIVQVATLYIMVQQVAGKIVRHQERQRQVQPQLRIVIFQRERRSVIQQAVVYIPTIVITLIIDVFLYFILRMNKL